MKRGGFLQSRYILETGRTFFKSAELSQPAKVFGEALMFSNSKFHGKRQRRFFQILSSIESADILKYKSLGKH
jgi:hypothetical protein